MHQNPNNLVDLRFQCQCSLSLPLLVIPTLTTTSLILPSVMSLSSFLSTSITIVHFTLYTYILKEIDDPHFLHDSIFIILQKLVLLYATYAWNWNVVMVGIFYFFFDWNIVDVAGIGNMGSYRMLTMISRIQISTYCICVKTLFEIFFSKYRLIEFWL